MAKHFSFHSAFVKDAGFDPAHYKILQSELPLWEILSSIPSGIGNAEGKYQFLPWEGPLERRHSALICPNGP